MKILLPLLAAVSAGLLALGAAALALRPGANLRAAFDERRAALRPGPAGPPVTEADLARLPEPVRRYLRRSGAVGRPPVTMVHAVFDATLWSAPGSAPMTGPAHQIDVLDPPRRLFFMTTRIRGLPVAVLHDYSGSAAAMTVRIARLFPVADHAGPELARTETVTFLNDIAAYAPSAMLRPEFSFAPIDESHAAVTYARGGVSVSAVLTISPDGDLTDFASDDRGDVRPDGSLDIMRWTTPLSGHAGFHSRRVPTEGRAIWHRPDGAFTYGAFRLRAIAFDGAGPA